MNEPKRRGRPTNAERAAKAALVESVRLDPPKACPECKQEVGHYDDCPVGMGVVISSPIGGEGIPEWPIGADAALLRAHGIKVDLLASAQAYALRVWEGQSVSLPRHERIERVKRALAGQNLPFDGVELP